MIELESSSKPEIITDLGRNTFLNKCEQYLTTLVDNIDSRFQNVHTSSDTIEHFSSQELPKY